MTPAFKTRVRHGLLVAIAAAVALAVPGRAQQSAPHVVVISIDGLKPADWGPDGRADMPTLRRMAADGASAAGVVGVFPTVTYPSHTSLITGVTPAAHGIYNNKLLDPEERSNAGWYWYAEAIRVPTLLGAVRSRGLRVASVNWPVTVGIEADQLFPEYFRSSHVETLSLLRALSRPSSLVDDVFAGAGGMEPWPLTDAKRTAIAAWILRTHRPHLLLLHIFESDSAQHDYGPGTPQAMAAFARADAHVATIRSAAAAAGIEQQTTIVVVSDHGFLPVGRQLQLNAAFKEQGWLRTDSRGKISGWEVYFQSSGGSGFVFLRDPGDAALRDRVGALLARLAADPATGIRRVLEEAELRALGADPRATFAVDMREGFYSSEAHDALTGTPTSRGGHGFDPARPELHASLVMAGPKVPRGAALGLVRMTQIAPTIASWFEVGLSPKADAPLTPPNGAWSR